MSHETPIRITVASPREFRNFVVVSIHAAISLRDSINGGAIIDDSGPYTVTTTSDIVERFSLRAFVLDPQLIANLLALVAYAFVSSRCGSLVHSLPSK